MNFTLKMAIVTSGRSQRSIAHQLGFTETRLSQLVHGWVLPSVAERDALAAVLGVPADQLFAHASLFESEARR